MSVELKPCPFCGESHKLFCTVSNMGGCHVLGEIGCIGCKVEIRHVFDSEFTDESIKKQLTKEWNRRAEP